MGSANVEDVYELTPLQRGMLLHAVHDGAADMYLGQHVYVLDGHLDADALIEAWRRTIASHPALRTSFHWEGLDKPLQVVHREVEPPVRQTDLSGTEDEAQDAQLDLMAARERAESFDLTTSPLQRLHTVRLADDRCALILTHHHLLLDGWSVPVFMNEIVARYQALTVGGPTPPPAPPFRDYIAWLQSQDVEAAERFWKETLADVVPFRLAAPPSGDVRRRGGVDRHVVGIGGAVDEGLRTTAARHQVTVNAVLQAAWSVVLYSRTGRTDVVFGCVSSGRPADLPDADRMIGMCVNTLPIPVTVPVDGDLGTWLRDVQSRNAAIRRFEFSSLSDVKRWAGAPGQELYDSLFVLGNYSFGVEAGESVTGALSVRSQRTFDKVSVPLSLIVTPAPVSELQFLYHRDRFDAAFVEELRGSLLAVLEAMTHAEHVGAVVSAAGPMRQAAPGLPETPDAPGARGDHPVGPGTPEEEAIAAVFRAVLERADIDATVSFFDLGGDSFGAVRAVGRIDGATLAMFALNPSVRELAAALAAAGPDEPQDELDAEIAELERRLAEKTGEIQ
ncbi:condensation domain-containing protein [Streptomyces sp. NPDC021020]|uniref:condensation domain-containing protein n=1 Tax=Streptomyces sp. NPDC021020 TaxID=3365109 RepID=UPI00379AC7A4